MFRGAGAAIGSPVPHSNVSRRSTAGYEPGVDLGPAARLELRWVARARLVRTAFQRRGSPHVPPIAIGVFGTGAAGGVAYLTSQNPEAQPAGASVLVRVLIIGSLAIAAAYAQSSVIQRRMGLLLSGACVFCSVWLLNGSSGSFAFSLGALLGGPALVVAYYLLLAYPSGRLRPGPDANFVKVLGGVTMVVWTVAILTGHQPPVRTPLLGCMPHCPRNAFYVGLSDSAVAPELRIVYRVIWLTVTFGAPLLLLRRWLSAATPLRRSLLPVLVVSCSAAVLLVAFLAAQRVGGQAAANAVGAVYIGTWAAIPLAIFAGFAAERLFMGQALARFVSELAHDEDADPGALMAARLEVPSLSIVYARPGSGSYVEFSGAPVALA